MEMVERSVDSLGRIVLPAKWRKGVENIVLVMESDRSTVLPKRRGSFLKLLGKVSFSSKELLDLDAFIAESSM